MKNIVKGLIVTAMMAPVALNAYGIGLSVPFYSNVEHKPTSSSDFKMTWEEDSASGVGFVYDSNIGKDKTYNYRLNIERTKVKGDHVPDFDKTSIINTFGFGVFRSENIRLFIGPRLDFDFEERLDGTGMGIALEPAFGVNVNLGKLFSLGVDFDYKIRGLSITGGDYDSNSDVDYQEQMSGMTSRFYLLFRFGENN